MSPADSLVDSLSDGLPIPQRYGAMAVVLLGIAMSVLDATIVNLALPGIVRSLHAEASSAVWVITAYQVAKLVMLLPCAMLGDLFGPRGVYLWGLSLFTLSSLACAFSPSLAVLIAARIAQGLGAGGLMSVNGALIRVIYPRRALGRGIALNSVVVATSSVAGPSIAAGILSIASWPWLFAVNVPIGLLVVVLGRRCLPGHPAAAPKAMRLRPLDVVLNAAMFGLAFLGADVLGSHAAGAASSSVPGTGVALLVGALVVGVVYIARQRRQPLPLFPLDLLRIPLFALSMCTSVTAFAAQMIAYVALPFLLLEALGRSPAAAGLLITAWPIATVVAAPIAGRLIGRVPDGLHGAVGLWILACGLAAMAMLGPHPGNADIAWRMALCGLGFGFFQSPNNHTILTSAPPARSGAASGMLGTARLTGQSIGSVLFGVILGALGAESMRGPSLALGLAAAFAAVAGVFSGLRLRARGVAGTGSPSAEARATSSVVG